MFTQPTFIKNLRQAALIALAVLTLSLASAQAAAACGPEFECESQHEVKADETLFSLSMKYQVTLWAMEYANYLPNPDFLSVGQKLCIPNLAVRGVPQIKILSIEAGRTVTVQGVDLPANQTVTVRLGKNGTLGVNGEVVGTATTDANGQFSATYTLPENLRADAIIAIRVEGQNGRYAYDWFWNQQ